MDKIKLLLNLENNTLWIQKKEQHRTNNKGDTGK